MKCNIWKFLSARHFSSNSIRNAKVCVVGAGPAGFYAAMHLTKQLPNVNIDIIEKLPVPFGLIRYLSFDVKFIFLYGCSSYLIFN